MSRRIFKYPLTVTGQQVIGVPAGATLLAVHAQKGVPCLWAMVDDALDCARSMERLTIMIVGTGHEFDLPGAHPGEARGFLGTFLLHDGAFVGHAFLVDRCCMPPTNG